VLSCIETVLSIWLATAISSEIRTFCTIYQLQACAGHVVAVSRLQSDVSDAAEYPRDYM
jgi:hypothetical protein